MASDLYPSYPMPISFPAAARQSMNDSDDTPPTVEYDDSGTGQNLPNCNHKPLVYSMVLGLSDKKCAQLFQVEHPLKYAPSKQHVPARQDCEVILLQRPKITFTKATIASSMPVLSVQDISYVSSLYELIQSWLQRYTSWLYRFPSYCSVCLMPGRQTTGSQQRG